jgi:hypothetical protein
MPTKFSDSPSIPSRAAKAQVRGPFSAGRDERRVASMEGTTTALMSETTDSDGIGRTSKLRRVRTSTGEAIEAVRQDEHRPWIDQLDVLVNLGLQAAGYEPLPGHRRVKIVVTED